MKATLYIKNMVCDRCIKVLKNEIKASNIDLLEIELGKLKLDIESDVDMEILKNIIKINGFEIIDSVEDKITEQVKIQLIKLVDDLPLNLSENLSVHLATNMNKDYSKISKVFSFTEGLTIERYFIRLKIEKVKELIQTQSYNFTEVSQLLDYNHINHLSRQFKNETGMSLSTYKLELRSHRNSLDQII